MNLRNSKKALQMNMMIGIIVGIITFFVLISFLNQTNPVVSESLAQSTCKSLTSLRSTDVGDFAKAFSLLNQKCVKEEIKIESSNSEIVYKGLGDGLLRCWQRYGEGEVKFLGTHDTTGSWCFVCGVARIGDGRFNSYEYDDFISWLKSEKVKTTSDSDEENSYFSTMKFKLANEETELDNDLQELLDKKEQIEEEFKEEYKEELEELETLKDKDDESSEKKMAELQAKLQKELVKSLGSNSELSFELLELKLRDFDSSDILYLVYRYDRWSQSFLDQIQENARFGGNIGLLAFYFWEEEDYENKEVQYVDVLTQEQYYRTCGTLPPGGYREVVGD